MIGIILGSGIFVAPAAVAAVAPDPVLAALLWFAGGIIALCGAACYAECAARMPADGGFFLYYERAFGKPVAQIAGWGAWLVTYPASLTAVAWIAARYLHGMLPRQPLGQTALASLLLLACASLVALGLKTGAWLQGVLTGAKIAVILAVVAAALWHGQAGVAPTALGEASSSQLLASDLSPGMCLAAFATLMWTFDGWSDITMLAGQIRRPERNLMLAALLGIMIPAACYALLQYSVMTLLPAPRAMLSPHVLFDALEVIGSRFASYTLGVLALLCAIGALHGITTAVSRLGWSMANAGDLPRAVALLDPRLRTPIRALIIPVLLAWVYLVTNNFNQLMGYFAFTIWLYYGLTAVALIRLRRRGVGGAEVWRAPGGALAPTVVLLAGFTMTALQVWQHPMRSVTGLVTIAVCVGLRGLSRLAFGTDDKRGALRPAEE